MAAEFNSTDVHVGVLICGSGQAMTMAANRYQNLRAALCDSVAMAKTTREHNDANMLSLAARFVTLDDMKQVIKLWLDTPFSGDDRHARRNRKLDGEG